MVALASFFQRSVVRCPENTEKYVVEQAFNGRPYWTGDVRSSRFVGTLSSKGGILYRPHIVNEICSQIKVALNMPVTRGVMVKGPQGVGKSHSLVNTVLKLQSTHNYLVTFIPNCEIWHTAFDLVKAICASFGVTPEELGIRHILISEDGAKDFVEKIDDALTLLGKQWVFVFDQINKIFLKEKNREAADASGLSFPFYMIATVLKTGRITSVISASANNEMAYKDRHEGFNEYIHPIQMTRTELKETFDDVDETNVDHVFKLTGGVPLYVWRFISEFHHNEEQYEGDIVDCVQDSLGRLETSSSARDWSFIRESVFASLLESETASRIYDKKFFVQERTGIRKFRYRAIVPLVLEACRSYLWNDLMSFVEDKEARLLQVCNDPDTTNDTRGRHFELMVIRRCVQRGVRFQVGNDQIDIPAALGMLEYKFSGQSLPRLRRTSQDGVYVPLDPNFPSIDLVWKFKNQVFGVQLHVTIHDDVTASFIGLCTHAGWFNEFDEIHLIYLSPEEDVMHLVTSRVEPAVYTTPATRTSPDEITRRITRRAISKDSVESLRDLMWPEGCSAHAYA